MSVWLPRQALRAWSVRSLVAHHLLIRASSALFLPPPPRTILPRHIPLHLVRYKSGHAVSSPDPKPSPPAPKEEQPLLSRAWKRVKHEAWHYWHGTKLLVSEVRISGRLQWKILHGESLTRRERRQLKRTTQDLLKLVPNPLLRWNPYTS